jgi:predicted nucleic acid-binding protein
MPFVLDASIAVAWAFREQHRASDQAFNRIQEDAASVPSLWWFELRNVLLVGERRGRISQRDTTLFLQEIAGFGVIVDTTPEEEALLRLARRHGLTVYDAAYLKLAIREGLPLATLDDELIRAARAENLPFVGE